MIAKIVIDDALRQQILNLTNAAELCDANGQVVAYAIKPAQHHEWIYSWAAQQLPEESPPAIDEFRAEGGMSIQEVRAYLKSVSASNPT